LFCDFGSIWDKMGASPGAYLANSLPKYIKNQGPKIIVFVSIVFVIV
jgi:hypothetical protein